MGEDAQKSGGSKPESLRAQVSGIVQQFVMNFSETRRALKRIRFMTYPSTSGHPGARDDA